MKLQIKIYYIQYILVLICARLDFFLFFLKEVAGNAC